MGKGEQTRQQIVTQAMTLVSQRGLEGLSLGALAESLDMSKSGLFAHFKSKDALGLAVLNEIVEQFTREVVLPSLKHPR
ncbi:MAG: TetR/AcrR family transcriptional regulator, partial [Archangium sp.]|nr:TetR/AcrR family transcriptional regulator [Archangium sp.]